MTFHPLVYLNVFRQYAEIPHHIVIALSSHCIAFALHFVCVNALFTQIYTFSQFLLHFGGKRGILVSPNTRRDTYVKICHFI